MVGVVDDDVVVVDVGVMVEAVVGLDDLMEIVDEQRVDLDAQTVVLDDLMELVGVLEVVVDVLEVVADVQKAVDDLVVVVDDPVMVVDAQVVPVDVLALIVDAEEEFGVEPELVVDVAKIADVVEEVLADDFVDQEGFADVDVKFVDVEEELAGGQEKVLADVMAESVAMKIDVETLLVDVVVVEVVAE